MVLSNLTPQQWALSDVIDQAISKWQTQFGTSDATEHIALNRIRRLAISYWQPLLNKIDCNNNDDMLWLNETIVDMQTAQTEADAQHVIENALDRMLILDVNRQTLYTSM